MEKSGEFSNRRAAARIAPLRTAKWDLGSVMVLACENGRCATPCWMRKVLLAAGFYHLAFAGWVVCWPHLWFDWLGIERPNHMLLWQGVGVVIGLLGTSLVVAARNPIRHWLAILAGFVKFTIGIAGFGFELLQQTLPARVLWWMAVDDLIWWLPFAALLWVCLRAHTGVPPTRSAPYDISEAARVYQLSNGKSLAEASESKLLALVFLRHFGCTFTRQILRGLEGIQKEARQHGAELVLVHMLQSGKEMEFLGERSGVPRIADPRCELYRAFGLGKGGFLDLFGPHVLWRTALSLFKGCGVGHLAGDGMQMPGAFLFRDGRILAAQPARSASDLPDLPQLFKTLPIPPKPDTVRA
jgi:hypothetical protein